MVTFVPGDPPPRLAFTVTRKVGSSVVRNRVRRQLRECFRHAARASALQGGAYLVSAKPGIVEHSFVEMADDLHKALEQAGALA